MKKIFLSCLILSCLVLKVYSQEDKSKKEDPKDKAVVMNMVLKIEKHKNEPFELLGAIKELSNKLNWYFNHNIYLTPETKSEITRRLIKIFDAIDDVDMNSASKVYIIEAIQDDHGFEARDFLMRILESGTEKQREETLRSIYFSQFRSDEIYDKIKSLVDKGIIKKEKSFGALKGANPQRAVKEIIEYLTTTDNIYGFTRYGSLLCHFDDPNLLDVLIDRYDEFKNAIPKDKKDYETFVPARAAFHRDLLRKYIKIRESKRLTTAIEVLKAKGISGDEDLPLWQEKLKSKDVSSRETVLDFLDFQIKDEGVSKEKVKIILEEAEKKEQNKKLKNKIRSILKELQIQKR